MLRKEVTMLAWAELQMKHYQGYIDNFTNIIKKPDLRIPYSSNREYMFFFSTHRIFIKIDNM